MPLIALLALSCGLGCEPTTLVLTYGDSKTFMAIGGSNNQEVWQLLMQRNLGCNVSLNIGTGSYAIGSIATNGITVAGRAAIVDADIAVVVRAPAKILFNLGSNDVTGMPVEATWKTNLAYIWDALHAKWPAAQIYYSETWRQGYNAESDTLATWYTAVAAGRDYVHLCDNERTWVKGSDDGATMFWDGIHFSRAGAAEKARLAAACLGF